MRPVMPAELSDYVELTALALADSCA